MRRRGVLARYQLQGTSSSSRFRRSAQAKGLTSYPLRAPSLKNGLFAKAGRALIASAADMAPSGDVAAVVAAAAASGHGLERFVQADAARCSRLPSAMPWTPSGPPLRAGSHPESVEQTAPSAPSAPRPQANARARTPQGVKLSRFDATLAQACGYFNVFGRRDVAGAKVSMAASVNAQNTTGGQGSSTALPSYRAWTWCRARTPCGTRGS